MEASDARSIRKAVWHGSIPVKIVLDFGESRVFDDSDPYYARTTLRERLVYLLLTPPPQLTIPRISYLPLFIPQIYKFFRPFLIDPDVSKEETAWFEFESVPLKWCAPTPNIMSPAAGAKLNELFGDT